MVPSSDLFTVDSLPLYNFFSEVVDHGNRVTENGPDIRGRVGTPGGNVEKLFFHH